MEFDHVPFLFFLFSQILKPADKNKKYPYGGLNAGRPVTPPRGQGKAKKK